MKKMIAACWIGGPLGVAIAWVICSLIFGPVSLSFAVPLAFGAVVGPFAASHKDGWKILLILGVGFGLSWAGILLVNWLMTLATATA